MNKTENAQTERPPIVVIMGHIDHGKSTLLDYIRDTNIVAGEAGGITQHTSAYEVQHKTSEGESKRITFLDTPGHEAFSDMRSRGAIVADIAILVVSAEDGVKSQTLDALSAIKDSGIPFIVAINKIDKPDANVDRTKQTLLEHEIYVEGYGGDIPCVPISAKRGDGIPELLDMMLLVAELAELRADSNASAEGIIIEANVDPKKGISATLIIQNGTLKRGMCVAAGDSVAPVRIFEDFLGKQINEATFSSPIRIVGWNKLPEVGSTFTSFQKKKEAESFAATNKCETQPIVRGVAPSEEDDTVILPVVIKADVAGTLEAIESAILKIPTELLILKIVHKGVGDVTEGDVKLVAGTHAPIIIAFNVKTDSLARSASEQSEVTIQTFDIIYKMTEWLEEEVKKRKPKIEQAEIRAKVKILKFFSQQKHKQIIGGKVIEGTLEQGALFRIDRRDNNIGTGKVLGLQSGKAEVKEVHEGNEFGAQIESKFEVAQGDILEAYVMVTK